MLYKKATLHQWLPAFLAPGIGFVDNFSTDNGWQGEGGDGWFQ